MPEVTLSLPVALGLLVLFLAVGATVVYVGLSATSHVGNPTEVPTQTETLVPSPTPTDTQLSTMAPTATEQPPFSYTINSGDTCGGIAIQFGVSTNSIIILNNLPASCNNLVVGQKLKIPFPTATPLPAAISTLLPDKATQSACEKVLYTVQENDTLSSIAANYGVSMQSIKDFNGMATDNVFIKLQLAIPLCARKTPVGPSPTATIPPPYPAPNLLLPSDGSAFTLANNVVTLQWASIGTLRSNEAYQITVEDITAGQASRIVDYVTDTKYIVPATFRPKANMAHVMRWWVAPVRQSGSDTKGQPIWDPAGAASYKRDFTWVGAAVAATPTP